MNTKEREKIRKRRAFVLEKLEKGADDQPPTYYRGYEKALEWVLMEV